MDEYGTATLEAEGLDSEVMAMLAEIDADLEASGHAGAELDEC